MWLIAGLGNPGLEYETTRHNLGFRALDLISSRWKIPLTIRERMISQGRGNYKGEQILLAKPLGYMNKSGVFLAPLIKREEIVGSRILVLVDDMDLPLGTVRFRKRGGSAGHRGMESIINHLGSDDFLRIRLGIGKPEDQRESVNYVLSGFDGNEEPVIERMLETVVGLVERIISEGEMEPVTMTTTLNTNGTEEEL
ncbi:aminoacyl-tRNA hydrolase [bacterium]|nr:MAG: aminoacyl-tRNA hydrolase [bacterium]